MRGWASTQKLGMWIFPDSEVMFFTGLSARTIILRLGAAPRACRPLRNAHIPSPR